MGPTGKKEPCSLSTCVEVCRHNLYFLDLQWPYSKIQDGTRGTGVMPVLYNGARTKDAIFCSLIVSLDGRLQTDIYVIQIQPAPVPQTAPQSDLAISHPTVHPRTPYTSIQLTARIIMEINLRIIVLSFQLRFKATAQSPQTREVRLLTLEAHHTDPLPGAFRTPCSVQTPPPQPQHQAVTRHCASMAF